MGRRTFAPEFKLEAVKLVRVSPRRALRKLLRDSSHLAVRVCCIANSISLGKQGPAGYAVGVRGTASDLFVQPGQRPGRDLRFRP